MAEFSPFTEKNTDPKSATYSVNPSRIIGFRGVPMRELGSAENIADANVLKPSCWHNGKTNRIEFARLLGAGGV